MNTLRHILSSVSIVALVAGCYSGAGESNPDEDTRSASEAITTPATPVGTITYSPIDPGPVTVNNRYLACPPPFPNAVIPTSNSTPCSQAIVKYQDAVAQFRAVEYEILLKCATVIDLLNFSQLTGAYYAAKQAVVDAENAMYETCGKACPPPTLPAGRCGHTKDTCGVTRFVSCPNGQHCVIPSGQQIGTCSPAGGGSSGSGSSSSGGNSGPGGVNACYGNCACPDGSASTLQVDDLGSCYCACTDVVIVFP